MTGPVDYSDWQWLRFPDTGGVFRCPPGAIGNWTGRGWEPCDEPPEVDDTKDPVTVVPDTQVAIKAPAASKTKQPAAPAPEGS